MESIAVNPNPRRKRNRFALAAVLALLWPCAARASSHREAPAISQDPTVDDTDPYAFVSPEDPTKVVLVGNWIPAEEPSGGPNYFRFADAARYRINIDVDGQLPVDDVIYEFAFQTETQVPESSTPPLDPSAGTFLAATGPITSLDDPHYNLRQYFTAMQLALAAADPHDAESIAWVRVHLGRELMAEGQRAEGERELDRALEVLPDYHLALAAKAHARVATGDLEEGMALYERAQRRVPAPDVVVALGELYAAVGRPADAKRQYELLEFIERSNVAGAATYSRQLAMFLADHGQRLDEALAIARRERSARADIFANDLLAWCLFKNGNISEARTAIDHARRLGTRDARLLFHAGMIHDALGDGETAANELTLAMQIDPGFDVLQAEVARLKLTSLAARSPQVHAPPRAAASGA